MSELRFKAEDDVDPDFRRFQRQIMADDARLSPGCSPGWPVRRAIAETVRRPWTANGPVMARMKNPRYWQRSSTPLTTRLWPFG